MALSQPSRSDGAGPGVRGLASERAIALLYGAAIAAGVLALFFVSRPYAGIVHDARLYVGYALAVLNPDSIGQDMVLADDGQSSFTVFPVLITIMVETFGSSLGAKLMSLAGLFVWFGAAVALAVALAQGRTRWVILIFLAVLPARFAGYDVFSFAEPFAVPRPFAEAFVLLALALFIGGWRLAALVPLLIAGLFHPIIALPGFAVYGWLIFFDPLTRVSRPIVGVGCGLIAVAGLLGAAALGLPVADRLFTVIDPAWRGVLETRSAYLFVTSWPLADWSRLMVHTVTVVIAAWLVTGRVRSLFVAVVGVGLGGVLAAALFGDALGSLLVMQVQPWRATWLLAVFALAGLGICSVRLWKRGGIARITLALLVLAWVEGDLPLVAIAASALALVLILLPMRPGIDLRRVAIVIWVVVAFFALLFFGMHLYALLLMLATMPDGASVGLDAVTTLNLLAIPFCVLAVLWANAKPNRWTTWTSAAVAVALIFVALGMWDDRKPAKIVTDDFSPDSLLRARFAGRPGEILWVGDGFATWSQAGRPNWMSRVQGAGSVFSQPLAMAWDARLRLLIELGLVDASLRTPFGREGQTSNAKPRLAKLSDAALEQLCRRPDAPAALIVRARILAESQISLERWKPSKWMAPVPDFSFKWDGESVVWTGDQNYFVLACAL